MSRRLSDSARTHHFVACRRTVVHRCTSRTGLNFIPSTDRNNPIRAQFVHSGGPNVGIGAEMNTLSLLLSAKKLVDVTGIEPVPPCLQRLFARTINDLRQGTSPALRSTEVTFCRLRDQPAVRRALTVIAKSNVTAGHAALFQIALVIFLGAIKFSSWRNFGRNRAREFFAGF
jgi:hypothetical protein